MDIMNMNEFLNEMNEFIEGICAAGLQGRPVALAHGAHHRREGEGAVVAHVRGVRVRLTARLSEPQSGLGAAYHLQVLIQELYRDALAILKAANEVAQLLEHGAAHEPARLQTLFFFIFTEFVTISLFVLRCLKFI